MRSIQKLKLISIGKQGQFGSYYEAHGDKFVNVFLDEREEKVYQIISSLRHSPLTNDQILAKMQEVAELYVEDIEDQIAQDAAGESL
jgi:hypothetical protein